MLVRAYLLCTLAAKVCANVVHRALGPPPYIVLLKLRRQVLKSLTLTLKRMLSGLCERVKSEESHALKIMK